MIREIKRKNAPITFNDDELAKWNIPPTITEDSDRSIAKEQGEVAREDVDAKDAVQLITDSLCKKPAWWVLESIPTSHTYKNTQGKWKTKWR